MGQALWAGLGSERLQAARALGELATALAEQDPLAASAEVERQLAAAVAGTPLAALHPERLLSLAAEASPVAARSARLELYPRGMPAERALRLCAGALGAEIASEDVVRLVATRYPEAVVASRQKSGRSSLSSMAPSSRRSLSLFGMSA